jgi:hypothetical protein
METPANQNAQHIERNTKTANAALQVCHDCGKTLDAYGECQDCEMPIKCDKCGNVSTNSENICDCPPDMTGVTWRLRWLS